MQFYKLWPLETTRYSCFLRANHKLVVNCKSKWFSPNLYIKLKKPNQQNYKVR